MAVDTAADAAPFASWCVLQGVRDLVYIVGTPDECARALAGLRAHQCLFREDGTCLVSLYRNAEFDAETARAAHGGEFQARVLSALALLDERGPAGVEALDPARGS